MNPNFEFVSRVSNEKGTFSSLSRQRGGKNRKWGCSRSMGSVENRKIDLGFDPFRPGMDSLSGVSCGLGSDVVCDHGSLNSGEHLDLKGGDVLVDDVRRLRIESEGDPNVARRNAGDLNESGDSLSGKLCRKGGENCWPPELPDRMEKLNLGAKSGSRSGRYVGGLFGKDLASELPSDLNKLNLKDPCDVNKQNYSSSSSSKDFMFGSNRKNNDTVDTGMTSTLPEKIKNLNIEDSDKSNGDQNESNVNKSDQAFDSGNFRNGGGGSGGVIDPMILDEIERLRIGDDSGLSRDDAGIHHSSMSKKEPLGKDLSRKGEQPELSGYIFGKKGMLPPVESRTLDPKGNLFTSSNQKIKFSAKKGAAKDNMSKGRTGKLKEPPSNISFWQNMSRKENNLQESSQSSESYSPMDISPNHDIQGDKQLVSETSLMSDDQPSTAPSATYSDDLTDEDLVRATECMDINKDNDLRNDDVNVQITHENMKSTFEEDEVELTRDLQNDHTQNFYTSSSEGSFTFAAPSTAQGDPSSSTRHSRKKSHMKADSDICIPTRSAAFSDATSSLLSHKSKTVASKNNIGNINSEIASSTAASRSAQEACEKWRLRGNQAYSNGEFKIAEDYYSQGLSCIPPNETSLDCLRATVLCYSNRAATRMSLGRMRDALQDCLAASKIDPNFFKVQLRAANCYLALGEVCDALRYFEKFLQSNDFSADNKLILEASGGIQKAQKVSECMDRSLEILQQRALTDMESALEMIAEALVISPYSEQLLERKATILFTLRRYEEVIQLCEQSLEGGEKNYPSLQSSELLKNYSFRIWRYSYIFRSYFYLGKLEEAISFLEKQEQWNSMVNKYGHDQLESLIPQVSTARELIRHKSAGNEAFQAGKHVEALEHYTAALSTNVESRPFSAVCFGNRAAAYQALGQIVDAIADCSLAIALDGNYLKAISRRANLYEMIRDYEQAAKDYQRIVCLFTRQVEDKTINSLADLRQARQRLFQMEEKARKGLPLNFYLILGVEATVTAADLKKAYRKAALRHHPDKVGQSLSLSRSESEDDGLWKEIAEEVHKDADRLFKMIGEAYAVLSNPTKRSQYDIEEEMRNGLRKSSGPQMHTQTDAAGCYTAERGGRSWHEPGRSSANPYSRGFEPTRSTRHY